MSCADADSYSKLSMVALGTKKGNRRVHGECIATFGVQAECVGARRRCVDILRIESRRLGDSVCCLVSVAYWFASADFPLELFTRSILNSFSIVSSTKGTRECGSIALS